MALQFTGTLLCLQLVAVTTTTVSARTSHFDDQSEQQWLDAVKDLLRKYEEIYNELEQQADSEPTETEPPTDPECITHIKIEAMTGCLFGAGFSPPEYQDDFMLVLRLYNGTELHAALSEPAPAESLYSVTLNFTENFESLMCILPYDISEIHLKASSEAKDNWFIEHINTSYSTNSNADYQLLTNDRYFEKWLDGGGKYTYDATDHLLKWSYKFTDVPDCGYGKGVCECRYDAKSCIFHLEVDEIRTFTSYQKHEVSNTTIMYVRGARGAVHFIDDDGTIQPAQTDSTCSNLDYEMCTEPQFVDGKTYRLGIAVNGQIPGPTIVVHEKQFVSIAVHNNLTSEGISVHWHGMHQIGTPWMDGVGQVTQCQIGPSSTFTYMYTASPSGTFWYHSHTGAQRTDGFYASLVVQERTDRIMTIKQMLSDCDIENFEDIPGEHTLSLIDWQREASIDLVSLINAKLGIYPDLPIGQIPTNKDTPASPTSSYDGARASATPFFSGLINGKGRHIDVPYIKTRLSVFTVEEGKLYRFRLVGAQGTFAYKFSIDNHKLIVVGTDGYWLEPIKEVDYIIIHSGERYDFLLNATQSSHENGNYWIQAETIEINATEGDPPFQPLGNIAEAILHYKQDDNDRGEINSMEYEHIEKYSPKNCTNTSRCLVVNCPFEKFHSSYHMECVNVNQMRLLEPTPSDEMPCANPDSDCKDCSHLLNFNFDGETFTASINGRNFILPAYPPQTQYEDFMSKDNRCNRTANCNPFTLACLCTHMIDLPYMKTIQLVLTNRGKTAFPHPIHVHGHTFHVVHIGYPTYYENNGSIQEPNTNISCADENCTNADCDTALCTTPIWSHKPSLSIDNKTVRKDTIILPAEGYVVINFLSNNPGFWFVHCHIETHQLQGMALILNEAQDQQLKAPDNMNQCGDFGVTTDEYAHYIKSAYAHY